MKPNIRKAIVPLCLAIALLGLSACGTTRSENGVTIEQGRSYNPLNWF